MDEIQKLRKFLKENNLTVAFAESVTCGLASYKMNTTPGTSDIFKGSIVAYNEDVKRNLLRIDSKLIDQYSAESQEVTDAMVISISRLIDANVYAAITGLASPGGTETKGKPIGTVFISILYNENLFSIRERFYGTPYQVKTKACNLLFRKIIEVVQKLE